jgi:hypothetical protein
VSGKIAGLPDKLTETPHTYALPLFPGGSDGVRGSGFRAGLDYDI